MSWWETALGGVIGFVLFFGAIIGGSGLVERIELAAGVEALIVIGLLCVAIAVGVGLVWLFPFLQLLEPGGRTRFQRFRFGFYAFVFAVVTSLIASVIWAVAQRG